MNDKILRLFFEKHRWEDALRKGVFKGIDSDVIRFYMSPVGREQLLAEIVSGQYVIETPHTALIPKDTPGEFRKVFINKPKGRLFLSIVNDILFEICPDMVHKSCTSYQKGIGHKIRTNRTKTSTLDNYYTLKCMRNNLLISRDLYDSVVRDM